MTLGVWALALIVPGVYGDGIGLIGFGKTMYQPTCAFACRGVVSKCTLACTPKDSNENHGTTHNPVTTPPECFVSDPAFLKTMALCLDNYCPSNGNPSIADLNDYWASHLGTGTLGTRQYVPVMSYVDALVAAREDETHASSGHGSEANATSASHHHRRDENSQMTKLVPRHGSMVMDDEVEMDAPDVNSPLPVIAAKEELNVTSFIPPKPWQLQYNGNGDFEANESDHSKYT